MRRLILLMALTAVICVSGGCSFNDSIVAEGAKDQKKDIHVIALMPVKNQTQDTRLSLMLRDKVSEVLKFKGYPQVVSDTTDTKVTKPADAAQAGKDGKAGLQDSAAGTGADAAMYCTLKESYASTTVFYAPATVAVQCELRNIQTGETLWEAQYKSTSRSFDLFKVRLKMKSIGGLEDALEDAVGKMMETLPYGPKLTITSSRVIPTES